MTKKTFITLFSFLTLAFLNVSNSIAQNTYSYPAAKTEAFDTLIYQQKLSDNYAWMSRPENEKELLNWAKAETNFTNEVLDSLNGNDTISKVYQDILSSLQEEIIVKGTQGNDVYYYKKMEDAKRWLVKKTSHEALEEKIMTLPFTFNGANYTAKKFAFANNKKLVAIMLVESGESNPHIRFLNLEEKTFLDDRIDAVMFNDASGVSMAWLPDDSGLIYSQAPTTNNEEEKYYRGILKVHRLGSNQENDPPIFGFGINPKLDIKDYETPYVYTFPYSPYIIARIRAGKGDNYAFAIHYSKINGRQTKWKKLENYRSNHGTFTANGDYLYAIDDAVPNSNVLKVNLKTGAPPTEWLKESDKILAMSSGDPSIVGGKHTLYLKYTSPGKQGILKADLADGQPKDIEMPFTGSVGEFNLYGEDDLLFVTTNWVRDFEYHAINHIDNSTTPFFQGNGNATNTSDFVTEIIVVPARDGEQIPVSLVYKKGSKIRDTPLPLLIESYGCFGSSMEPFFNPENFIWLEMGGIYAAAHIRGGSEKGGSWYAAGAYPTKMNSINDIVDVAEYFVDNKYTTGAQQAIIGASCGTLNVGLATLQRPDLFSAGVYMVGIPDLVTNKGPSFGRGQNDLGPLDTAEGFESRYSISSYYHIVPNNSAPAMLVINGANDYIVPVHNVARYVAKLQNVQKSNRPALFMVDWNNGHNDAGTEPDDFIRRWKFLFWQTGHPGFQSK